MDDYLESTPTVEEASNKTKDLVKLFVKSEFQLTKFGSSTNQHPTEIEPKLTPNHEKAIPNADESNVTMLCDSNGITHLISL